MNAWGATEVVLVIGAFGTMLVSVIASIGAAVQAARANRISQQTDGKADKILSDVNGHLSTATSDNKVLAEQVAGLRALVDALSSAKAEADRVAGQLASAATVPAPRSQETRTRSSDAGS